FGGWAGMTQVKRTGFIFALMLTIVIGILGCSNDPGEANINSETENRKEAVVPAPSSDSEKNEGPAQDLPPEDVTITFFSTSASLTKENFQTNVADPVKKQFPQITVELIGE